MASIRRLKGDVDFLIDEVVADCCTCVAINKSNNDEVFTIINDAILFRNELRDRINHPEDKHNAKVVKAHYMAIRRDMVSQVENLFERLSNSFSK